MRDIVCTSFILFLVLDQLGDFCYYFEKKEKKENQSCRGFFLLYTCNLLLVCFIAVHNG